MTNEEKARDMVEKSRKIAKCVFDAPGPDHFAEELKRLCEDLDQFEKTVVLATALMALHDTHAKMRASLD